MSVDSGCDIWQTSGQKYSTVVFDLLESKRTTSYSNIFLKAECVELFQINAIKQEIFKYLL